MTAYYNENEPYCAAWLRNLIAANLIAPGNVDERDIRDVIPTDLAPYAQCHFFAGIGGWSRALRLAAWPDHRPVWTGSCPCQPFSQAGKRRGFADERHLWPHWFHLISQCRPAIIFGEQVAKATDWLGLVRGDLEALDYAVGAMPIEAASAGADQLRDRYWFVASDGSRRRGESGEWQTEQPRRTEVERASPVGRSNSPRLAFGSQPEIFGGDVRHQGAPVGEAGVGGADVGCACGNGWPQGQPFTSLARFRDTFESASSDVPNTFEQRLRGAGPSTVVGTSAGMQGADEQRERLRSDAGAVRASEYEWVFGADGKARRVKPGISLLAHDVPARVAKLRAFGNAIVPQVAAQFIIACEECRL